MQQTFYNVVNVVLRYFSFLVALCCRRTNGSTGTIEPIFTCCKRLTPQHVFLCQLSDSPLGKLDIVLVKHTKPVTVSGLPRL